jgi:hypothetical protein
MTSGGKGRGGEVGLLHSLSAVLLEFAKTKTAPLWVSHSNDPTDTGFAKYPTTSPTTSARLVE